VGGNVVAQGVEGMSAIQAASYGSSTVDSVVDALRLRATGTLRRKKIASLHARERQGATRRMKVSGRRPRTFADALEGNCAPRGAARARSCTLQPGCLAPKTSSINAERE
jgi:hypothetical protein